ncbi:MAG: phenylalanine--tRNA ligase subunit beta [Thermoprotei archaeon ex4572_64]|nr:MAG: phenylalanine--tRNA ligase subunit beta [Thermoprotei archaeon ex4572_64]
MPVITFKLNDLERLLGRSLSLDEFEMATNKIKGELESIEDDEVKLEVTTDRPDFFSVEGIARALKGILEIELGLKKVNVLKGKVEVYVEDVPNRPYIAVGVVRNVNLDDEAIRQIIQLQEKIHATYGRDRRKIAIGLYDLDLVKPPLRYKLMSIDEVKYIPLGESRVMRGSEILELTEKGRLYGKYSIFNGKIATLLDSENQILTIVPVLGNEELKVTEKTKNVIIDVTSSTDLESAVNVLEIVMYNLVERNGYFETVQIHAPWGVIETPKLKFNEWKLQVSYVNDYLGLELSRDEVVKYILMSRHDVECIGNDLKVVTAPYRINILHPVDIVEDVAIAYGYDKIPREIPNQSVKGSLLRITLVRKLIRNIMLGLGFQEVSNYVMTSEEFIKKVTGVDKVVSVLNPKSELYNCLRNTIWPILLKVLSENKPLTFSGLRIFEIGNVAYPVEKSGNKVEEEVHLAFAITSKELTLTDGLIVVNSLMKSLDLKCRFVECSLVSMISERTACIEVNNEVVGFVAEVKPEVVLEHGLETPVIVSELSITKLLGDRY